MGQPVNRTLEIAAIGKDASGIGHVAGPVVSFRGKGDPLRSLNVNIDPVQAGSGDPSPDNVRPISGHTKVNVWRTGKNLFDVDKVSSSAFGLSVTVDNNVVSYSGTASSGGYATLQSFYFPKPGQYHYHLDGDGIFLRGYTNRGKDGIENVTDITQVYRLTTPSLVVGNQYSGEISNIQIELGTTATAYEPYSGDEYTIQLGQTVYGGTLDVTNGVLTVDRAMVDMGTLTWNYYSDDRNGFYAAVSGRKYGSGIGVISSMYKYLGTTNNSNTLITMATGTMAAHRTNTSVLVKDTRYTDAAIFTTAMSGVQLVYELDTPITIQLTPTEVTTLLGQNNVWADTGDVDVEYSASGGPGGKLAILLRERRELLIALKMGMTQEEAGLLGSLPGMSLGSGLSPGIIRPGASAQDEDEEEIL